MSNTIKSYISILLVCFFWGFSFISTKVCLQWFTPFSLAFYRFLIASIILFFALKLNEKDIKIDKKDIIRFIVCGFSGVFLYFAFENLAIEMLSASLAAIFLALLPAFAIFADYFILKAPFTRAKTLSVCLSVIGAGLVAGFNMDGNSETMILGIVLIVLSVVSWIAFSYLAAPLQKKYSPLKATFYQSVFGTIFFLISLPFSMPNFEGFNMTGLLNLLFLGVICSAVCYLFYNFAIKHISIVICSIFINLMPIVTIVASMFILNEKINLMQAIGAIFIIGSVFLVTKSEEKKINSD